MNLKFNFSNFIKDRYKLFVILGFLFSFVLLGYSWIIINNNPKESEVFYSGTGATQVSFNYKGQAATYIPASNEEFTVVVVVKPNGHHFKAADFAFSYDPAKLQYISGVTINGIQSLRNPSASGGMITTSIYTGLSDDTAFTNEKSILELRFKKLADVESAIGVASGTNIKITEDIAVNDLGNTTDLVVKKKQENPPSGSGKVNVSLVYKGQASTYIPAQNEEFVVQVVVDPQGNHFKAGDLAFSYNKNELQYVSGNKTNVEFLRNINVVQGSPTNKLTVSVYTGLSDDTAFSVRKDILEFRFKRIGTNESSIAIVRSETNLKSTENITVNDLGNTTNLVVKVSGSISTPTPTPIVTPTPTPTPSPTPRADCFSCNSSYQCVLDTGCRMSGPRCSGLTSICPTPTPTPTPPTVTPTPTPTPSPTPRADCFSCNSSYQCVLDTGCRMSGPRCSGVGGVCATPVPESKVRKVKFGFPVSGLEKRSGLVIKANITVTMREKSWNQSYTGNINLTSDNNGIFLSPEIEINSNAIYLDVWIKGEKHLGRVFRDLAPYSNISFSNIIMLKENLEPGDLPLPSDNYKQDGKINSLDRDFIVQNWGSTDKNILKVADLNYDGKVNGFDSALLIKTLSTKSDEK